jgi:hypothetical protein
MAAVGRSIVCRVSYKGKQLHPPVGACLFKPFPVALIFSISIFFIFDKTVF